MLVEADPFDRASGGAHFRTFPSFTQVPEPRQLWWWRTRGLRRDSGFPKFPKIKTFRWQLCFWQSSPCLALFSKNQFFKTIFRIRTLWWFIDLALHFVRLDSELWHWVRTVVSPMNKIGFPRDVRARLHEGRMERTLWDGRYMGKRGWNTTTPTTFVSWWR